MKEKIYQKIKELGIECKPDFTLEDLPQYLEAIGKVKGWEEEEYFVKPDGSGYGYRPESLCHFLEICRLYAEEPNKGWEYLDNLLK